MLFVSKRLNGICATSTSIGTGNGGPPAVFGVITISASVGIRGVNRADDTTTIQSALNRVPPNEGRPNPPLKVDGKCGSKTTRAIQQFQLKQFGWSGADGLVEPGRQTIRRLNELAGGALASKVAPAPAAAEPVVLPDLGPGLKRARKYIRAAQANLSAASSHLEGEDSPGGGLEPLSRERRMRALNDNFSIDAIPVPFRRRTFRIIENVFFRMAQVFQRPGGLWGPATFEPDVLGNTKDLAYTNHGGYFREGQHRFEKGGVRIRLDSIYLCAAFTRLTVVDHQALLHIHELAHFVGSPELIGDHAYNSQGDKIRRLPPALKVLTAECYSNFAWHAVHPGTRPPI